MQADSAANVLFDTGKADLNPGAARNLDVIVQFLTWVPTPSIWICPNAVRTP
jgi:outer membrane protein OmpA-like peptidoglycan-associated protein